MRYGGLCHRSISRSEAISHAYAVTALHVVQGGASIIRMNIVVADPTVPGGRTLGTRDLGAGRIDGYSVPEGRTVPLWM